MIPTLSSLSIGVVSTRDNCQLCLEHLSNSTPGNESVDPVCGHALHKRCYEAMASHDSEARCGICRDPFVFTKLPYEKRRGESQLYFVLVRLNEVFTMKNATSETFIVRAKTLLRNSLPEVAEWSKINLSRMYRIEPGATYPSGPNNLVDRTLLYLETPDAQNLKSFERITFEIVKHPSSAPIYWDATSKRFERNYMFHIVLTWKGQAVLMPYPLDIRELTQVIIPEFMLTQNTLAQRIEILSKPLSEIVMTDHDAVQFVAQIMIGHQVAIRMSRSTRNEFIEVMETLGKVQSSQQTLPEAFKELLQRIEPQATVMKDLLLNMYYFLKDFVNNYNSWYSSAMPRMLKFQ